ncbi:MAG: hypothetical protein QXF26_03705 [Candidatus Bathyarchaeia archaeon]
MLETYDIGSLPFEGDFAKFQRGVEEDPLLSLLHPSEKSEERSYFEDKVLKGYISKVMAGIDVPVYPQFRDMNQMFIDILKGVVKRPQGYAVVGKIRLRREKMMLPEVETLKENSRRISEITGRPLRLRVCVTGPYTLASLFEHRRPETFTSLAEPISSIVECNVFKTKYGGVEVVSIDEPLFGLVDDPLLDFGEDGVESLLKSWELVFGAAKSKGVRTVYHLHSTTNGLFWEVKNADIVESHVDDLLYSSSRTRELLKIHDKLLNASIAITVFDSLIRSRLYTTEMSAEDINQKIGLVWSSIKAGNVSPLDFLETVDTMKIRLRRIVEAFGYERVAYVGPECGLRSFPSYDSAVELLRRVSVAAHQFRA